MPASRASFSTGRIYYYLISKLKLNVAFSSDDHSVRALVVSCQSELRWSCGTGGGMTMCCGGGSGRACFDLSIITVINQFTSISLSSSTNTAPYHTPTIVTSPYT